MTADSPRNARRHSRCDLAAERERVAALLEIESSARREGFRTIAGVDEVGRGCLAGPVVAGAVVLDGSTVLFGLDDSKALLPEVRRDLAARIEAHAVGVGIGFATAAEIDAIGIAPANALAMRRALDALSEAGVEPELVLFDAFTIPGLPIPQRAFVRGDARCAAIAAASIVAKCARDRFLEDLHGVYPYYGFDEHRGYGTARHLAALRRHGPSPVHRLTFDGVVPGPAPRAARAA